MNPKPFVIKCLNCGWSKITTGTKDDLLELTEIKSNCKTCGKWRRFRCLNCSQPCYLKRIKTN